MTSCSALHSLKYHYIHKNINACQSNKKFTKILNVLLRYLISVVSFVLAIILVIEEVMDDWQDDIDK